jgi:hypothetical protein
MFFKENKTLSPYCLVVLKRLILTYFFLQFLVKMFYFGKNLLPHTNCYVITHKSIIFKKTLFLEKKNYFFCAHGGRC